MQSLCQIKASTYRPEISILGLRLGQAYLSLPSNLILGSFLERRAVLFPPRPSLCFLLPSASKTPSCPQCPLVSLFLFPNNNGCWTLLNSERGVDNRNITRKSQDSVARETHFPPICFPFHPPTPLTSMSARVRSSPSFSCPRTYTCVMAKQAAIGKALPARASAATSNVSCIKEVHSVIGSYLSLCISLDN